MEVVLEGAGGEFCLVVIYQFMVPVRCSSHSIISSDDSGRGGGRGGRGYMSGGGESLLLFLAFVI